MHFMILGAECMLKKPMAGIFGNANLSLPIDQQTLANLQTKGWTALHAKSPTRPDSEWR